MKLKDLTNPFIELMEFEQERLRLLAETNRFLEEIKMPYYCDKCRSKWYNQSSCPLHNQNNCPVAKQEQMKMDKPVFEFIDNKSSRLYKIWENGKVTFIENLMWPSHTDQIGITINRLAEYKYKQEQSMIPNTREEAVKKVEQATRKTYGSGLIDALEALGLLKFEKPKVEETNPKQTPKQIIEYWVGPCAADQIISGLIKEGWIMQQQSKPEEAKTETKSGCIDSGYLTFGNHSVAVEEIIRLMAMKGYTISKRDSDGTAVR